MTDEIRKELETMALRLSLIADNLDAARLPMAAWYAMNAARYSIQAVLAR